uniref:Uncharacterized protein n=1 Tax=Anguilla anguilla TaxID=7936 RepID=A0A0E9XYH4_ANGAN
MCSVQGPKRRPGKSKKRCLYSVQSSKPGNQR